MNVTTDNPSKIAAPALTNRQRFLAATRCQPVDRPPVWLMRQAGRALPEYRALKEKYTFLQLVQTPDLAAEVTLQPVRRFGFDAAILFSDILVIPEALGQPYRFRETGGIEMDFKISSTADVKKLSVERVCEKLNYVAGALKILRKELGDQTALIGFSGSPWTLATFMMEGGSAKEHTRALALFHEDRKTFNGLMEKLTAAVTAYLQMQLASGVDALQIFDSNGGILPTDEFQEASGRWMREIVATIGTPSSGTARKIGVQASACSVDTLKPELQRAGPEAGVPITVFSLGTHNNWNDLAATGANVLGIDWKFSLAQARNLIPEGIGLQGNLNPTLLAEATSEQITAETNRLLAEMRGRNGHIFNLGHGVPPTAKLENIAALVETVRSFK